MFFRAFLRATTLQKNTDRPLSVAYFVNVTNKGFHMHIPMLRFQGTVSFPLGTKSKKDHIQDVGGNSVFRYSSRKQDSIELPEEIKTQRQAVMAAMQESPVSREEWKRFKSRAVPGFAFAGFMPIPPEKIQDNGEQVEIDYGDDQLLRGQLHTEITTRLGIIPQDDEGPKSTTAEYQELQAKYLENVFTPIGQSLATELKERNLSLAIADAPPGQLLDKTLRQYSDRSSIVAVEKPTASEGNPKDAVIQMAQEAKSKQNSNIGLAFLKIPDSNTIYIGMVGDDTEVKPVSKKLQFHPNTPGKQVSAVLSDAASQYLIDYMNFRLD